MIKSIASTLFLLLTALSLRAQTLSISGKVVDASDTSAIVSAGLVIYLSADSSDKHFTETDLDGHFVFNNLTKNKYTIKISYIGYKPLYVKVEMGQKNINLGILKLKSVNLKEVQVEGHQVRAEQIGDTVQYNADAFKTNPDANAEDLLTKMPGIVITNGSVQAHGEDVKQVLIDGKPFFGDDPTTALRNLPADVIDKVQVFDKMSDQSAFTGFDDGNSQKTINIITKKNKQNGQFGKATAGYGTDNRYMAGENLNLFNNNRKISIIGMTNNINQQNFSTQDLLGISGGSGGGGGRGGGGGSRGGAGGRGGGSSGYNPPGSSSSNFLVGQNGGNNITNSAGLNYSDSIGHRLYLSGSYFYNNNTNNTQSTLARTYLPPFNNLLYNEADKSTSNSYNHRANLRMEYTIDSANSLIFTPKFSYQNTDMSSTTDALSRNSIFDTTSKSTNDYNLNSSGYDFNASLLWRHKFEKRGRTLSINIGTDIAPKTASDTLRYFKKGYGSNDSTSDQHSTSPSTSKNFNASISYTEPLSKTSQLQVNYNPSYTQNSLDKRTYLMENTGEYTKLDSLLSNSYNYTTFINKGGVSYRARIKDINLSVGVNFQMTKLDGSLNLPTSFSASKTFESILPNAMFTEKFANKSNLRIMYNTSSGVPSISQLQNTVNNNNPLLLSVGNPDLQQSYTHSIVTRYGKTNTDKAHTFFVFASVSNTSNYIGNSTIFAFKDSILPSGVKLARGAQLTMPVNLNNYWNARTFATYGLPMDFMKSNLNLNAGVSFSSLPSMINNVLNYSSTYALNPGLVLSSNISENVDFTLSYNSSYNIVKNSTNTLSNNNYFTHTAGLKFNWIFWKGFTLNTDISHTLYTGLASAYNQSLFLVNAGVGKKLFKDQSGEIKLSVFDLLNQNSSVTRTQTDPYIDDVRTQVLQRYFMLSFTYNLKHFIAKAN